MGGVQLSCCKHVDIDFDDDKDVFLYWVGAGAEGARPGYRARIGVGRVVRATILICATHTVSPFFTKIYGPVLFKSYILMNFLHKYSHTHFRIYDNAHFKTYNNFVKNSV